MKRVYELYLSLGSNIEPRLSYLESAIDCLNDYFEFCRGSSLYESGPLDDLEQERFINLCLHYRTDESDPFKILEITQGIEESIGRQKIAGRPKGPRTIDIDIILFNDCAIESELLTIPHKSMFERNFVLIPLVEILENGNYYLKKYDIQSRIKKNNSQLVVKLGEEYCGKFDFKGRR